MPQIGKISFVQCFVAMLLISGTVCQCPKSGEPHFYEMPEATVSKPEMMCQCPKSGEPHFYFLLPFIKAICIGCVNALGRANLISTDADRRR